jgi:hypothetical protein
MTRICLTTIFLVLLAAAAALSSRPARAQLLDNNARRGVPGQPDIPQLPPPPGASIVTPSFPVPSIHPARRQEPYAPLSAPTLPHGMTITVDKALSDRPGSDDERSTSPIGRPVQAARELAKCWAPPVPAKGETVEVTIRFGFGGNGMVRGTPRITYVKAPEGAKADVVRASILDAIKACTPINFTKTMAAAVPGYPLSVRYIGRRADETQDRPKDRPQDPPKDRQ